MKNPFLGPYFPYFKVNEHLAGKFTAHQFNWSYVFLSPFSSVWTTIFKTHLLLIVSDSSKVHFLFFPLFWRAKLNLSFYLLNKYRPIWTVFSQGRAFLGSKAHPSLCFPPFLFPSFFVGDSFFRFPFSLVNRYLGTMIKPFI